MYCIFLLGMKYAGDNLYKFVTNSDGTIWQTDDTDVLITKLAEILKTHPSGTVSVVRNIDVDVDISINGCTPVDVTLTLEELVARHNLMVGGGS